MVSLKIPLKDRKKVLSRIIKPVPGRLDVVEGTLSSHFGDIEAAYIKAMKNQEEGIIVKKSMSVYRCGVRNEDWVKMKPDYFKGGVQDLDLCVIGAYFGEGAAKIGKGGDWRQHLTHFLLGMVEKADLANPNNSKIVALCKVGSGLSLKDLNEIRAQLRNCWVQTKKISLPKYFCKEKFSKNDFPDAVLISLSDSVVLQIRAAEIIKAKAFGFGFTLRFPRVEKIRKDKNWNEAVSSIEIKNYILEKNMKLKRARASGEELFTKNGEGSELRLDSGEEEPENFKFKKVKKRRKNNKGKIIDVLENFQQAKIEDKVQESDLLKGHEILIISCGKKFSKKELETMILKHGGKRVQNCLESTTLAVAAEKDFRTGAINQKYGLSVLSVEWLVESIKNGRLEDFKPRFIIENSEWLKLRNKEKFDKFGDDFFEDTNLNELKKILENEELEQELKIFEKEKNFNFEERLELEREIFEEKKLLENISYCVGLLEKEDLEFVSSMVKSYLLDKFYGRKSC